MSAELIKAVRFVIDTFKRDEEQGYQSKDRQFVISILERELLNAEKEAVSLDSISPSG